MDASEYRAEYVSFSRDDERERHRLYASGHDLVATTGDERIEDRYADLHTPDAASELQRILEATPTQFETERTGLARLANHARTSWVARQSRELTNELRECVLRREISFEGERLPLAYVAQRIAGESRPQARRELGARWLDETPACDDLLRARRDRQNESARALGLADYIALRERIAAGVSPRSRADEPKRDATSPPNVLATHARAYLDLTANAYRARFPMRLARVLPGEDARQVTYADSLRFERLPHIDPYFPASELVATYESVLRDFSLDGITGGRLHFAARGMNPRTVEPRARTFAPDPPAEVRLEVRTGAGGVEGYRALLLAVGSAQHYVWSSAELGRKQPEFVHPSGDEGAADEILRLAHAHLFASPLRDPQWLSAHRKVTFEQSRFVARALGFAEVFRARRAAGRVIARQMFDTAGEADMPTEARANDYAALMNEATGFAYDPRTCFADVFGDGDDPAAELRALMFAAAAGEVLRTRHGSRWWASRAARDELIDAWNTGTRYTVEELTRLIGAGVPDAEALAASHLELMRGGEE